jgi:hypothetical protein
MKRANDCLCHSRAGNGPALSFFQNPCYPRADECGAEAARAS